MMQEVQRSRTSRRLKNYNGCILLIDFSKIAETVGSVEHGQLWNHKRIIEPWDAIVDGNRSASEGLKSRASGVATSTSLVARRVS